MIKLLQLTLTCFLIGYTLDGFSQGAKPKTKIISPINNSKYVAAQDIMLLGTATDSKGNLLPASACTWRVKLFHGIGESQHVHDGIGTYRGVIQATFTTPLTDDHNLLGDIFYRFLFIATDNGQADTSYVDVYPQICNISFNTDPSGLELGVFGSSAQPTPFIAKAVVGSLLQFAVTSDAVLNDISYKFIKWENGSKVVSQAFYVTEKDTTIKAFFAKVTAIMSASLASKFIISPIPVQDILDIDIPQLVSKSNFKITIIDALSTAIYKNQFFNTSKVSVNTSSFNSGFYYLIIDTDQGQLLKKIIKN